MHEGWENCFQIYRLSFFFPMTDLSAIKDWEAASPNESFPASFVTHSNTSPCPRSGACLCNGSGRSGMEAGKCSMC